MTDPTAPHIDHTCHDMQPPFPGPCLACEREKATAPPVLSPLLTMTEDDLSMARNFTSPTTSQLQVFAELDAQRAEVARLEARIAELEKDVVFHADCRPNRRHAEAEVARLKSENDRFAKRHSAQALTIAQYQDQFHRLREALKALIIDANRLCDRNFGGTYEKDCRRSIAAAQAVMAPKETE